MKKLIITLSILVFALQAFAQSPYKISYQAVIRDAGNGLVANTAVGTQISILQGSETGTAVFVETHTDTTNDNGLLSLEIGGGTVVSGSMVDIDWSMGPYFIQTETDPLGGTSYSITGVSQLASVPFAFQAINADTAWYARKAGEATTALEAENSVTAEFADSTNKAAFAYSTTSKKRSVVFTPGMINPSNLSGSFGQMGNGQPTLDMPEGGITEFRLSVPVPSDYGGGPIDMRVLYTSDSNAGTFDCSFFARARELGTDLNLGPGGGGLLIPAPTMANHLAEGNTNLATISPGVKIIFLQFRRRSDSAADTSTSTLRILGFVMEYDEK